MSRSPARLATDVSLAERTTLGIGGRAAFHVEASSSDEIQEALAWARERGLATFVLGGGSNLVVSDRGYPGLVIAVGTTFRERDGERLRVGAGHDWDELVAHSVEEGLAGLECLSGIPGKVGATPIQNVGAYGQEVGETVTLVETIDRETGEALTMRGDECAFGYRDSIFKGELRDRRVVVSVTFTLRPGGPPSIRYPELERHLRSIGLASPSLAEVRNAIIELRRAKSMVLDEADENRRSAGSFFMNPIVTDEAADEARARVRARGVLREGESMPAFAAGEGRTKLSAAWLIERAGFAKGTSVGRVGISTKHSLALVNRGGASASELLSFARRVRDGVEQAFGVRIVPEPELVGFSPEETNDLRA